MAQLAIKGHATRGSEVIALLKMLGGVNIYSLCGNEKYTYYTIDSDKEIKGGSYVFGDEPLHYFTLEEFKEEFPYKVGDKVIYEDKIREITKMVWEAQTNTVAYKLDDKLYCNVINELQPYKEETMKEEDEKSANHVFDTEIISFDIAQRDKYELDLQGKFEVVLREGKYYVERIKPRYPKTYKECCDILKIPNDERYIDVDVPLDYNKLLSAFTKLLICRDAYWKMAGEEMGLGKPWEPDYTDKSYEQGSPIKYVIYYTGTHITKEQKCTPSYILTFPTEEMRDAFCENFKELIENVKELL